MDIKRNDPRQGDEAEKRITYCLDQLEEVNEFSDGIDWQTEVAPHLTVEELIGALVAADVKLSDLGNLPDAWRKKAEAHETQPGIIDLSYAHAHRDCAGDLERSLQANNQE